MYMYMIPVWKDRESHVYVFLWACEGAQVFTATATFVERPSLTMTNSTVCIPNFLRMETGNVYMATGLLSLD